MPGIADFNSADVFIKGWENERGTRDLAPLRHIGRERLTSRKFVGFGKPLDFTVQAAWGIVRL